MTSIDTGLDTDIRDFATSVRGICESTPTPDQWSPTAPADDRNPLLRSRLDEAGWFDLAAEQHGTEFLGAAAVELGRALAPLDIVDALLGHAVAVDAGGALSRYHTAGQPVWLCSTAGAQLARVITADAVNYVDAQAVTSISTELLPGTVAADAVDAWTAAMTGYIAGLAVGALDLARSHAEQRIAFGRPLSELDAVAKKIADCATTAEGLQMAASRGSDAYVLRQAPVAAFRVTRACHQILGALGFTLEYPLQRYSRRVEALRAWTPITVDALHAGRSR